MPIQPSVTSVRLPVETRGRRLAVSVRCSLREGEHSTPELGIIDPDRHPTSALLVVEVAVSSHAIDRGCKAELYAVAEILAYWLIDIPARTVEVRTDPHPAGYRTLHTLGAGDVLLPPCESVPSSLPRSRSTSADASVTTSAMARCRLLTHRVKRLEHAAVGDSVRRAQA